MLNISHILCFGWTVENVDEFLENDDKSEEELDDSPAEGDRDEDKTENDGADEGNDANEEEKEDDDDFEGTAWGCNI